MTWDNFFDDVEDYRVQGRCLHPMEDLLMLILCGLLADCEDFEEIEDYGKERIEFLKTFLGLGSPRTGQLRSCAHQPEEQ